MRSAIYGRVSGVDDPRTGSLETQNEDATKHAISLGYTTGPADVFLDKFTGEELYDRPSLSSLRELIRSGVYQAVVVKFLDRLSREPAHLAILFDEAERHGCKILSATEEIDNSPLGELIRNIRGYAAKMERIRIKERTQAEMKKIVASGKPPCSGLPRFGYTYVKETRARVINESEAAVVRRIFDLAIEGNAMRHIAYILNAEGVPSAAESRGRKNKDGRKTLWGRSTICAILADKSYYGEPMSWNKTRNTGKRKKTGRPEVEKLKSDQWTPLAEPTPVIVDRETWDRANGVICGRKTDKSARSRNKIKWRLLRGMVFCGTCEKTMTVQEVAKWTKSKGRYEFYRCMSNYRVSEIPGMPKNGCGNGRTQIHHADAEVWRQVTELLKDRDSIRAQIESSTRPDPSLDADVATHNAEIARAETTIKRLVDRLGDEEDEVVAVAMKEKIGLQKKVIAGHRRALEDLAARLAQRDSIAEAVTLIESILARTDVDLQARTEQALGLQAGELVTDIRDWLKDGLAGMAGPVVSENQKRQILEALGVKVFLSRKEVRVDVNVPLVTATTSAAGRAPPSALGASASR